MTSNPRRLPFVAALSLLALAAASALTRPASPQDPAPPAPPDESYLAVITADDVPVRCGAAESYYPFGEVKTGDLVKVIGEKFTWIRVLVDGPAFREFFGYVRLLKADAGLVRLDANAKKIRTLGPVDLKAPNLNTRFDPRNSWKAILILEPDVELTVLETIETEREIVYKVVLPKKAEGWISASFIQRATPEQVAAWTEAMTHPQAKAPAADTPAVDADQTPPGEAEPVLAREEQTVTPVTQQPTTSPTAATTTRPQPSATPAGREEPGAPTGQAPPDSTQATEPPAPAPSEAQAQLEGLEAAYQQLCKEPIETAEVLPLRDLYLKLAEEHPDSRRIARYASARAEQLAIWSELQERRAELARLRKRLDLSAEEAEAFRLALENTADYVAVGRLAASTVYDGRFLPKLFRVQDPATGRTIAYLRPDDGFDLTEMLGQLVGIVGTKAYDGGLRLNTIQPKRIDLLTPQR
jgi:hypothetical protein